jgi:hypothetical protein
MCCCRRREGRWLTDVSELRPLLQPGASCRFTLQVSVTFLLDSLMLQCMNVLWKRMAPFIGSGQPWAPCSLG